jgi:hypothetical protein
MFMSCQQGAGEYHNIKIGNESLEILAHLRYLGITTTNHSCIHEELKTTVTSEKKNLMPFTSKS